MRLLFRLTVVACILGNFREDHDFRTSVRLAARAVNLVILKIARLHHVNQYAIRIIEVYGIAAFTQPHGRSAHVVLINIERKE